MHTPSSFYLKCGVIFFSSVFTTVIIAEKCTTPNNEEAECVSLYTCTSIIELLRKQTPESIAFIQKSNCGGSSVNPKVCCGSISSTLKPINEEDALFPDRRYCGYQHADDYLHKNENSNIDEFPWLAVVELTRHKDNTIITACGGSLINYRYVLTAAHCLITTDNTVSGVRLGEYHAKNASDCVTNGDYLECIESEKYGVEKIIIHDQFYGRPVGPNDIALLRLDRKVQYSDYIRPICLPIPGGVAAKPGDIVQVSGFGLIVKNTTEQAQIKKKILSKIVTYKECAQEYLNRGPDVTNNHICSVDLDTNKDFACAGDSGAPVMFSYKNQWQQEGVVSFGRVCGEGAPTVHVKVVNYIDWIKKNVKP